MGVGIILIVIWIIAIILASPLIFVKQLVHYDLNLQSYGIDTIAYCIEEWPIDHGRAYYSAFSLCIQYLLPILIVTAAYTLIYDKLKNRISVSTTTTTITDRNVERGRRMRRTNCLLFSIAIIFCISWLPLNIFNLYSDIYLTDHPVTQTIMVSYAVCHMIGMSSACSNPMLYGWLNENFRKEFKEILCRQQSNGAGNSSGGGGDTRRMVVADGTQIKRKIKIDGTENGVVTEMSVLVR